MTSSLRRSLLLVVVLAPFAAAQGPPPSPVRVDPVREVTLQERRFATGDVRAARRARIAAEEEGRVLELLVDEGERVAQGAVLARLDATRLELDLSVLRAEEEAAKAVKVEREREVEQEARDLASVRNLFERKAANQKELADAETALARAEARLAQAASQLAVLGARSALLRRRLADMEVKAPFGGVIAAVETEIGQWIDVGGAVAELVSDEAEAWISVPQRHLAGLRARHGPIALRVAGGDEIAVSDWRVVPVVDPGVRTLIVIAPLPAAEAVAPGMSVDAWVPTGEEALRLTVHADALLRNDVGPYLYVAAPGQEPETLQAMPVQVEVLWREGTRAVVRPGALQPGAQAIVEGHLRLYPTAAVRVVQNGEAAGGEEGPPGDGPGGGQEGTDGR